MESAEIPWVVLGIFAAPFIGWQGWKRYQKHRLLNSYKSRGIETTATITHVVSSTSAPRVITEWFPYGGTLPFRYVYRHGFMPGTKSHLLPSEGDVLQIIYLPEDPRGSVIQGVTDDLDRKMMMTNREHRATYGPPNLTGQTRS